VLRDPGPGHIPGSRRPAAAGGRLLRLGALLVGTALLLAAIGVAAVLGVDAELRRTPHGDGLVPADVDRNTPVPQPVPLAADTDLDRWAAGIADRSGVPERALRAYGNAELAQRAATPDCRLSWATVAGIGRVESDHGRLGRADLDADGVARPRIVGVPLDGSAGVREVPDTDAGRLDGDPTYDRAVGPMQFLPASWARYGADGNGDGVRDPHQLDDAALAAARHVCADDRDTASGAGWWAGVLAYNRSGEYARLVWAAADRYAGTDPRP
jgi:hypothetical protein